MFYTYSELTTRYKTLCLCVKVHPSLDIVHASYDALLSAVLFLCLFVAQTSAFTSKPPELSVFARVVTQRLYSCVTDFTLMITYHLLHPLWNDYCGQQPLTYL